MNKLLTTLVVVASTAVAAQGFAADSAMAKDAKHDKDAAPAAQTTKSESPGVKKHTHMAKKTHKTDSQPTAAPASNK
jgi:hypothetical protein